MSLDALRNLLVPVLCGFCWLWCCLPPLAAEEPGRGPRVGGSDRPALAETFEANPTSTLRWRDFEYQYALPQIPSNLFIGLGLGAKYRPMIPGIDYVGLTGQGYIHNAHLWLMLKSGFTGYLCFLWLSGLFLWRGFSSWRRLMIPWQRATVLGFTLTHVAVLLGSIVNPMLMQWYWIPLIGLMLAVNELLIQGALPEEQETKQRLSRRAPVPVTDRRITAQNPSSTGATRG